MTMNKSDLARYLDLADHRPDAKPNDIKTLCQKVLKHGFNSAFVNPFYVKLASELLAAKSRVGTVISFPIGQDTKATKAVAAIGAAKDGADELDVSVNVGLFMAGQDQEVLTEMKAVVGAARNLKKAIIIKFIIETGFLTEDQVKKASELVLRSGADFVKTCSGWGPRGAELKDVKLIREAVGKEIRVKVAGGIHSLEKAMKFIKVGADRIGTSKAVEIIGEMEKIVD